MVFYKESETTEAYHLKAVIVFKKSILWSKSMWTFHYILQS